LPLIFSDLLRKKFRVNLRKLVTNPKSGFFFNPLPSSYKTIFSPNLLFNFMKSKPIVPTIFLLASLFFFSKNLSAQTSNSKLQTLNSQIQISLTDAKMRTLLEVQAGQNMLSLCNLTAGNTYTVAAVGAAQGQMASFEIEPSAQQVQSTQRLPYPNVTRFTAAAECVDIQLKATDAQGTATLPMYFSVKCETCPEANFWKENLLQKAGAAVLKVDDNFSAEELIKEVLIDGECFDVQNVSFSGIGSQIGTFSNGATNIGFSSGVIMATGGITVAPGPNFVDNASGGFGIPTPDSDLGNLANGQTYDMANIEFDFTPTETPVSFQFVFASEEYCEYVGTQFNDVFGFFISGPGIPGTKNIALVPMTNQPITINTVNHINNDQYYVNNQSIFSFDLCGQFPSFDQAVNEVQYDGFTLPFIAVADVIPCQTYHIKLKIADVSDGIFDSAVFLKGGSFDGGGDATVDFVVNNDPDAAETNEGCDQISLVFDRVGSSQSQPLTIAFSVGGTATPGLDYAPLDSAYTIPAGQDQLVVPVTVFSDLLTEGTETIVLTLDDACSCDATQLTLTILDRLPMADTMITVAICSGSGTTLTANPLGGTAPFTYEWSTNDTTQSIFVNPAGTTSYAVTIADFCGDTAVNYFTVNVVPLIELIDSVNFCVGSSVVIGDSTYTQPTTVIETIPGAGGACDTIATYVLEVLPLNTFADTISFCPGGSVTIGDSTYTQPTTVVEILPGSGGACDTMATYVLKLSPQITFTQFISFCPGESVTLGDSTYSQSGTVVLTFPGSGGACDTIGIYILNLLPQVSFTQTFTFCPGDPVFINGNVYTEAGTYLDTLPGAGGECDTLATYVLVSLTPAPSIVKIICPNDIEVTADPPVANYTLPAASTDCTCPGISLQLMQGLPSGSVFSGGATQVCYEAKDSCGNTASCCFKVTVPDEEPCEEVAVGCIKYELLSITQNADGHKTYKIRVKNNCTNKLMYAAFSLPLGVTAVAPLNNSVYVAPSGREYSVRNPNYSPFYSIRFKSDMAGIANGESDIFEFTLPEQAAVPTGIHAIVRVQPKIFYENYLFTAGCPVEIISKPVQEEQEERQDLTTFEKLSSPSVFPNPTDGALFADLSDWEGEQVQIQIFDAQGRRVQHLTATAADVPQEIQLPKNLTAGLYFLEIQGENGEKQAVRFVLQR
jgi:hypothetical protein